MGSFTDALRSFVEKALFSQVISSASAQKMAEGGNKTETVDINPQDFDRIMQSEIDKAILASPDFKPVKEKMDKMDQGNVKKIQALSSKQFGNLTSLASNPAGFFSTGLIRILAKATGAVGIALVLMAFINFVIDEAMKPGRALDRRFKRLAGDEIMQFWTLQEQEKLRAGFTEVRVTTMPGLRGGAFQVDGNLFTHQFVTGTQQSVTDYRITTQKVATYTSSFSRLDSDGNPIWDRYGGGHR